MIYETWETIIHEELDGVASAADRVRLYDQLSRDPQLRAYYEEMCRVTAAVHRVPAEEPPASLKTAILRAIEHITPSWLPVRASRVKSSKTPWWADIRAAMAARPIWSGGFVFTSGIAMGLLIFALFGQTPTLPTQDLTGTMVPAEQFERLGVQNVDMDDVHGRIETGLSPQGPCLYLELDAPQRAEVTVGFAGRQHALRGFYQANPMNGLVSFDAGGLRILHQGKNRYLLTEAPATSTPEDVLVRIQAGEEVFEERLPFTR
jgi:hypothetical protein